MKPRITLEQAVGRTLTEVVLGKDNDQIILMFGQDYACLGLDLGFEDRDTKICEKDANHWFGVDELDRLGIWPKAEREAERAAALAASAEYQEKLEREQYERLHKKYGPADKQATA